MSLWRVVTTSNIGSLRASRSQYSVVDSPIREKVFVPVTQPDAKTEIPLATINMRLV